MIAQMIFIYTFYAIKKGITVAWKEGFLWSRAEEKDLELLIYCLSV